MHTSRLHLVSPEIVDRTVARLGMARVLSEAERAVFDRLALDRRRHDWLAGRVAAKRALRRAARESDGIRLAYGAITVWNDDAGAPCFTVEAHPGLARRWNISIAHTVGAGIAALACTDQSGRVGVDIERTKPLSLALVRRVLTAHEIERLQTRPGHAPDPLVVWTIKEAVLKAGRGCCGALRQIELDWDARGRITARLVGVRGSCPEIAVAHRMIGPYTVARAFWRKSGAPAYEGSRSSSRHVRRRARPPSLRSEHYDR